MCLGFDTFRHFMPVLLAGTCSLLTSCMNFSQKNIEPVLGKTSWRSFDGKEMPWLAREVPRGESLRAVVITVHGLSGAASDFWPLGEAWPPHGIAVYGMELRGQGNDPELKSRGDIVSAEQWQKDLLLSLIHISEPTRPY